MPPAACRRCLVTRADLLKSRGPNRIDPLLASKVGSNMVGVQVGMEFGLRGPNSTVNSACASGSDSIGVALNHIRMGHADVMIAGGSDATVTPITIAATGIVGALTRNPDPNTASRPFDLNRNGFVFGEGAGMLVLESYEHAKERGATILAELAGAGWTFDAYNETAPYAEMQAQAMKMALQDAETLRRMKWTISMPMGPAPSSMTAPRRRLSKWYSVRGLIKYR